MVASLCRLGCGAVHQQQRVARLLLLRVVRSAGGMRGPLVVATCRHLGVVAAAAAPPAGGDVVGGGAWGKDRREVLLVGRLCVSVCVG